MKKMCYAGMLFMICMLLAACKNDIPPEPEVNKFVHGQEAAIQTSGFVIEAVDSFTVKHQVKGNDAYFECIVKGASFRNDGAKIILYVDGKRVKEIDHAAFIVKGLNKGTHKIKLELIGPNQQGIMGEKEIDININ